LVVIDFILNLAGLLLWLSWRAVSLDPLAKRTPATLTGTLRRAEPRRLKRWHFLAALGALVVVRAWFYGQLGPAVNWTPRLGLGVVTLPFPLAHRGHVFFLSALLFSALSFLRVLVLFHAWLLFLAIVNRCESQPDPVQKLIRLQLGWLGRWPWFVQAMLPLVAVAMLWLALHPLLLAAGVVTRAQSEMQLVAQGFLVGFGAFFSLKYLIPPLLLVHLVASYVYFGASPAWDFVGTTGRNLLASLRRLPLRLGKVDLAPLAGILLTLLLLHALPEFALKELKQYNLTIWPQ
jgi:uncharacterized protein YggT (Ycf19 family)